MLRRFATVLTATATLSAVAAPALACPPPAGGEQSTGGDRLTISYRSDERAAEHSFTLRCNPAGGSHPDVRAACDAVTDATRGLRDPWEPVSADTACTQVYGGPQTARITGVWKGRPVDASFNRANGCEIARWDTLTPALPAAG